MRFLHVDCRDEGVGKRVVAHSEHGAAFRGVLGQNPKSGVRVLLIQIGGWFISQNDSRLIHERLGKKCELPLPFREIPDPVIGKREKTADRQRVGCQHHGVPDGMTAENGRGGDGLEQGFVFRRECCPCEETETAAQPLPGP